MRCEWEAGSFRNRVPEPWTPSLIANAAVTTREHIMPKLRVASINGEWMNSWFTADGTPAAFLPTFKLPGEQQSNSSSKTAGRLAGVIRAIDPDILALQEAPSRKEELDLFIATHLSASGGPLYESILGDSGGAQKLAL